MALSEQIPPRWRWLLVGAGAICACAAVAVLRVGFAINVPFAISLALVLAASSTLLLYSSIRRRFGDPGRAVRLSLIAAMFSAVLSAIAGGMLFPRPAGILSLLASVLYFFMSLCLIRGGLGSEKTDPRNAQFKDRSAGLIIGGLLQLLLGGCCALLIPLMLVAISAGVPTGGPMNAQMRVATLGFYALLTVALIWLGIGSILARRWARTVTLVLAWMWLAMGVLSLIVVIVWVPDVFWAASQQQIPTPVQNAIQAVTLGIMVCIYVVLPGTFVLFYRSPHVKATCEFKDPHVRWTDRIPLPVLALSMLLGLGAACLVLSAGSGFGIPLFGVLWQGAPGAVAALSMAVLFGYLAWATYQRKMGAWWTALIAFAVFFASSVVTFSRIDLMEYYRELDMPEEQLKLIEESGMVERMNMPLMMSVSAIVIVAFMLWVRPYFAALAARAES